MDVKDMMAEEQDIYLELLTLAECVAAHFQDTDAPLGLRAAALVKRAHDLASQSCD